MCFATNLARASVSGLNDRAIYTRTRSKKILLAAMVYKAINSILLR
jgi:hypothetical protein